MAIIQQSTNTVLNNTTINQVANNQPDRLNNPAPVRNQNTQARRGTPNEPANVYGQAAGIAAGVAAGTAVWNAGGNMMTTGAAMIITGYGVMAAMQRRGPQNNTSPHETNQQPETRQDNDYEADIFAIRAGEVALRTAAQREQSPTQQIEAAAEAVLKEGGSPVEIMQVIWKKGGSPEAVLHSAVYLVASAILQGMDLHKQEIGAVIDFVIYLTKGNTDTIEEISTQALAVFDSGGTASAVATAASSAAEKLHSDTASAA